MKKKVFVLWSVLLCLALTNTINGKSGGDNDDTQNYVFVDSMKNSEERNAGGDGCNLEKYDRTIYAHNAVEDWKEVNAKAGIVTGGHVFFGYYGKIKIGADSRVEITVLRPICEYSKCNICEKSHLDKPFRRF